MHVAVFHSLAEVLQPDLDEEPADHPQTSTAVDLKCFGKQVEETQTQEEGASESEEQGQLTSQACADRFPEGGAHHGDQEQDESRRHAVWASRMSRGLDSA